MSDEPSSAESSSEAADVERVRRSIDLADLHAMRDRERRQESPCDLAHPLPLVGDAIAQIPDDRKREQAIAAFRMLVNQRQGKIVKLASLAAAGRSVGDDTIERFTARERQLYRRLRETLHAARVDLLDAAGHATDERPSDVDQFALDADFGEVADGD